MTAEEEGVCKVCGKKFTQPKIGRRKKFCTRACCDSFYGKKKRAMEKSGAIPKETRICSACGKPFMAYPSATATRCRPCALGMKPKKKKKTFTASLDNTPDGADPRDMWLDKDRAETAPAPAVCRIKRMPVPLPPMGKPRTEEGKDSKEGEDG